MSPLDLLDTLNRSAGRFALVATYEFDPVFFEHRILRTKGFESADRVLVLMDKGRYQALINQGIAGAAFNRRYFVVPIGRSPGVFHPKLYLVLGKHLVTGIVGSSNCTPGGIAYNMELCSTFSIRHENAEAPESFSLSIIRQIYEALRAFCAELPGLSDTIEQRFFSPIEEEYPWLHRNIVGLDQQQDVELLHSHGTPLWPEIDRRLEAFEVQRITVLAPFFDSDLALLKRMNERWPSAEMTVVAQPKYSNLPAQHFGELLDSGKNVRLLAATPPPGRRLHAKAIAFETLEGTFWLAGSANATLAALDGRNTEASLWFATEELAKAILASDDLTIQELDPSEFVPGTYEEPKNQENVAAASPLHLDLVTLREDGTIVVRSRADQELEDVALRIRNFNEELPALSLPLRDARRGEARIKLEDSQIGQIRGTAICELKGILGGKEKLSNRVSLIQMNQLFRERDAGGGSRNPLRKIAETGEGLVSQLDSLGSVREAVEFLSHCSIKFDDGETNTKGIGSTIWKPRDPFKSDIPTHWLSIPIQNATEELRDAVWGFVQRHQKEKLEKHIRRGNLNGLSNFLDIFRTLNGLLLAFNGRKLEGDPPVIPHPYVTVGMQRNLKLLIGSFRSDEDQNFGFVASIRFNLGGDQQIIQERLRRERVPEMIQAAVESMIEVRKSALKLPADDSWTMARRDWVSGWIMENGLDVPSDEDVNLARREYGCIGIAA